MITKSLLFALMVYGIAIVVTFLVALIVKGIAIVVRKGEKSAAVKTEE